MVVEGKRRGCGGGADEMVSVHGYYCVSGRPEPHINGMN